MQELALHILDIVENGITAGANLIQILVEEMPSEDRLTLRVDDNGRGMPAEKLKKPDDPFITSRTTRRVGLGLPLLAAAAKRCDGRLEVESQPGKGTRVTAVFRYRHIDRAPIGDMAATMATLLMGNPSVDFVYTHVFEGDRFVFDTREIKKELGDDAFTDPVIVHHLTQSLRDSLDRLGRKSG